jgi:hypothetical protein
VRHSRIPIRSSFFFFSVFKFKKKKILYPLCCSVQLQSTEGSADFLQRMSSDLNQRAQKIKEKRQEIVVGWKVRRKNNNLS